MTWLGDYTVYGDLPVTYTDSQIEGVSAGVVQLFMAAAGFIGDSVVTLLSTDPTSSVANPQEPGCQLCKCDLLLAFPDAVEPAATEMMIASGLAYYASGMGLPGNVILTLNWSSTTVTLGTPTVPQFPMMSSAALGNTTASADLQ
ncbi:hypothetical protein [Paraburkholderia ferrariae]|uniref:Uncharacterized protein n=1 Tax=Paraburkholderia ferrariae TaxID=386056 RepID=A0ABU9RXE3_9BURK